MKIIVKNSDTVNNAKFRLRADEGGVINVLQEIGAVAQQEDGTWNFCLKPSPLMYYPIRISSDNGGVYTVDDNNNIHIHTLSDVTLDIASAETIVLPEGLVNAGDPTWSPDTQQLILSCYNTTTKTYSSVGLSKGISGKFDTPIVFDPEVFTSNVSGEYLYSTEFSSDGSTIVFYINGGSEVLIYEKQENSNYFVGTVKNIGMPIQSVSLSPAGNKFVVTSNISNMISVYNIDGSLVGQLPWTDLTVYKRGFIFVTWISDDVFTTSTTIATSLEGTVYQVDSDGYISVIKVTDSLEVLRQNHTVGYYIAIESKLSKDNIVLAISSESGEWIYKVFKVDLVTGEFIFIKDIGARDLIEYIFMQKINESYRIIYKNGGFSEDERDFIAIDLDVSPKVISCVGSSTAFQVRSDLSSRTIEVQVNDGPWTDLFDTADLSVAFQPANPGATLRIENTTGDVKQVRLRSSKDLGLYVNSDGLSENMHINEVEQDNQAYVLYDVNGNIINPRLESNKDYTGRDFDDTSTENDYAIYFRSADFCLSPNIVAPLISCDGANEQVSIFVSLSWQGESGGAITVYNDETNEIISDIQGYYLDFPDYNMANETSPQIEYISTIAETSSSSTEYENYRTTQQLITYRNISSTPVRLRIEILNYEQDRFPKTFIVEETEFHHNPTFALMEETTQRVVYGVCLAPTIPDACTPTTLTVVPTLTTKSLDSSQQYTITYSVNDGPDVVASGRPVYSFTDDYVTDPCLAIAGYLRQANPQVNGVSFDLFFGFNFPTLEGYEIYDQMPENTAPFTIKFKKTDVANLVGTDLINLMFEQDEVILHSCWHTTDD